MGLAEIYEQKFGQGTEKTADGEAAAETPASEATTTTQETDLTDEQMDKVLNEMTEEQLQSLAKEVADDVKKSQEKEKATHQKEADELYAAGRIFGQGFLTEVNGKGAEKTGSEGAGMKKFADLLNKELEGKKE